MMMPFQATMIPVYNTLYGLRLLDSPLAIILPQWFMPFAAIMLYLFAIQISSEIIEAAQVDGAGVWKLVWHIVLPLMKHGVWSIGLLQLIDSWNMIEQPLVFLASIELMPLSIMIRQSIEQNTDRHGEANPKGGDAVSFLELTVKLLDVLLKVVGIAAGLKSLCSNKKRKNTRRNKKNHRR